MLHALGCLRTAVLFYDFTLSTSHGIALQDVAFLAAAMIEFFGWYVGMGCMIDEIEIVERWCHETHCRYTQKQGEIAPPLRI